MASHNHHLQSVMYVDRSGTIGGDIPTYIRRYSNYLNEKREGYKSMGYDFCKIKRGLENIFVKVKEIFMRDDLEKRMDFFEPWRSIR